MLLTSEPLRELVTATIADLGTSKALEYLSCVHIVDECNEYTKASRVSKLRLEAGATAGLVDGVEGGQGAGMRLELGHSERVKCKERTEFGKGVESLEGRELGGGGGEATPVLVRVAMVRVGMKGS